MVGTGRTAEIQDLQKNGTTGRTRSRVRRQHRQTHQKTMQEYDDLCIGTWNTQGADWSWLEERHVAKFVCLVEVMREGKIDVMCLTDLHGKMDERAGVDTRFCTCMVEEFLLVQCGRVGFFMTPAVYKAWLGHARCWDNDGRVASIDLQVGSCFVRVASVYKPPVGGQNNTMRQEVLEAVLRVRADVGDDHCVVFGGDWNSHIGRDGVDGRHAMLTPSSFGGKQMLKWLGSRDVATKLAVIDHRLVLKRRGTWRHSVGDNWYELDYFVASAAYTGRFSKLKVYAVGESDHAAKAVLFRLAGVPKKADKHWRKSIINVRSSFAVSGLKDWEVSAEYQKQLKQKLVNKNTWSEVAEVVREVATDVLGPKRKTGKDEETTEQSQKRKNLHMQARRLFEQARECDDPAKSKELLKQSRRVAREHRKALRQIEKEQWSGVCKRLEAADAMGNQLGFWQEMRNIKLWGAPRAKAVQFAPEELREHFSQIGLKPNNVSEEMLTSMEPILGTCFELDVTPEAEEITKNLYAMRESAPGPDLITVSMLKAGGDVLHEKIVKTVQKMWETDPEEWEQICHEAEVIALFKKGARHALDNYRGICLLQVISRLIARIGARRLSAYVEANNIIATEQWGFRPNRSAVDALFVMCRLMADGCRQDDPDPLVLDMMDIKKAYPNCSRNAMDKALELVGIPARLRNILAKLDSLTLYKCRSSVGLSDGYSTLRGCREGCPAAPIKFNILHHVATMELRKKWREKGLADRVKITSHKDEAVWPSARGIGRSQVPKLKPEQQTGTQNLESVGYADDTTIVTRLSESEERRKYTYEVYGAWGHTIHPDKWQRVWASKHEPAKRRRVKQKSKPTITDIEKNAKSLGCYLEADGGYTREQNHRSSKAAMVWLRLKKQTEKVRISNKTKGRLLKASVIAALLYGVETRAPPAKQVNKMQKQINGYERRLLLGVGGGTKDMVGKMTQADIKTRLDTYTIQLEIDTKIVRYVGHISRLPSDRWEKLILLGHLQPSQPGVKSKGKDTWWDHTRKLMAEVMRGREGHWWELATDRLAWKQAQREWKKQRVNLERSDTQAARQTKWDLVAPLYQSHFILTRLWGNTKVPSGAGTPIEGQPEQWIKQVLVAGGVHSKGWVDGVDHEWINMFEDEASKTWLKLEGAKVRRKLQAKIWSEFDGTLPIDDHLIPTRRLNSKQKVSQGPQPRAAPPVPPPAMEVKAPRRLRGKQTVPEGTFTKVTTESSSNDTYVKCDWCGCMFKQISMTQHKKLYCPMRDQDSQIDPRKNRKILRPPPPKAKVETTEHDSVEKKEMPKAPYVHVRWQENLPRAPRLLTSVPPAGDYVRPEPKAKRPSQAPLMIIEDGCWGGCSRCNQCGACRKRTCNGRCTGCARCRKCRRWGEMLKEGISEASKKQDEALALPSVIKRKAADPFNSAKAAVTAARPKTAAAGSSPCPYCKEWLPFWHQEGCAKMPFELWVQALRARAIAKHGQEVIDSWSIQCQHCGSPFASGASKRVHLSGCERRRNEESLPLNTYPVVRHT